MATIQKITAREILNAKGDPTVEVGITLDSGLHTTASTPSGTSMSSYEALDLKDRDEQHFLGNGVLKAVQSVTDSIAPALAGKDPSNQQDIDLLMKELDGTQNKSKLGANAILAVSLAVARASALEKNIPLFQHIGELSGITDFTIPTPLFNLINGGQHALGSFDFQEFIVTPVASKTYDQALQMVYAIRQTLKKMLLLNNLSTLVGDEGGYSPQLQGNEQGLQFLKDAVVESGYHPGEDVFLGMDAASTNFYKDGKYHLKDNVQPQTAQDMVALYAKLANEFHMLYLEDIFAEDDWESWKLAMTDLANRSMIIGDDLISTNPARLTMAIEQKAINGLIIKPNQIGTVTETIAVVKQAKEAGLTTVVSHRSGETNDDFIADFAVGVGADYCKFGAPDRGERVAKYNRLLQIEKEI